MNSTLNLTLKLSNRLQNREFMHQAFGQEALYNRHIHSTNPWNVCHVPGTGLMTGDAVVKKARSGSDAGTAPNSTTWNTYMVNLIFKDFGEYLLHRENKTSGELGLFHFL